MQSEELTQPSPGNLQGDIKARNEQTLTQRSFKALKWNYLGAFSRVGLQFVIGVVLARLLGPEPFGLVALASLVLGLGALFADFGMASALIQRQEITARDIRYVFTLQSLIGLALTISLELTAGPIADFFKRPDAVPVLQALFLLFCIQGLGQTASALLRRNLDFRRLQLAQIVSYLFGFVVLGLPLAFYGLGVWSLVVAQLSQALFCTLLTYGMIRHPIMPNLRSEDHSFLHFGLKVTATNLSNWGLACLDSVVLGRVFGTIQLGLYNRAFSLVGMPTYNIVSSLQSVLLSASARVQDDKERLRQTYLGALGIIGFICLPMFFVVAVIPETVITGVYGNKWLAAVTLLTPLALAMPCSALMGLGGPLMTGMGKVGYEMRIQFTSLILFVPLLWWASGYSIETVAWSVFVSYALRFVLVTHVTLGLLQASWRSVVDVLTGPVVLATICAALVFVLDKALIVVALPDALRLTFVGCIAAIVAILGFMLGQKWLMSKPVAQFLRQIAPSLPGYLRRLIVV